MIKQFGSQLILSYIKSQTQLLYLNKLLRICVPSRRYELHFKIIQ